MKSKKPAHSLTDEDIRQNNAEFCEALAKLGWNNDRAGKELGVTRSLVSMIVNGKARVQKPLCKLIELRLWLSQEARADEVVIMDRLAEFGPADREIVADVILKILDGYIALAKRRG